MLGLQFGKPGDGNCCPLLLPGDVEEDWLDIIAKIVRSRVTAFSKQERVELFFWLDSQMQQTCDLLTNIITSEAGMALNELLLDPVS